MHGLGHVVNAPDETTARWSVHCHGFPDLEETETSVSPSVDRLPDCCHLGHSCVVTHPCVLRFLHSPAYLSLTDPPHLVL